MKLYLLEHINERLEYEKVKQDFAYIDNFFKLPKELEEISEKEKEKAEEYIRLFNNYLDNINSRCDQIQSNLNSEPLMFKIYENVDFKKYSPLTVVLLTLTLYVLQKDLAFTQEYSLGVKNIVIPNLDYSDKEISLNYQKIKIPNYFNEYILFIPDDIYFNEWGMAAGILGDYKYLANDMFQNGFNARFIQATILYIQLSGGSSILDKPNLLGAIYGYADIAVGSGLVGVHKNPLREQDFKT
nr:hypothetical protein [Campylobacter coli]